MAGEKWTTLTSQLFVIILSLLMLHCWALPLQQGDSQGLVLCFNRTQADLAFEIIQSNISQFSKGKPGCHHDIETSQDQGNNICPTVRTFQLDMRREPPLLMQTRCACPTGQTRYKFDRTNQYRCVQRSRQRVVLRQLKNLTDSDNGKTACQTGHPMLYGWETVHQDYACELQVTLGQ